MRVTTPIDEEIIDDWAEADLTSHPRFSARVMAAFARALIDLRRRVSELESQR